jgi:hypothetical protein
MSTFQKIRWADRWIGGFCAVAAIGGLPVRGSPETANPPLATALRLDPIVPAADIASADVEDAWSAALGGVAVVLVRTPDHARRLLLEAAGVEAGEAIGLPVNSDRALVESVKRYGARPMFLGLDDALAPTARDVRIAWAQPDGGAGGVGTATWIDYSDTVPIPGVAPEAGAAIFGLHLAADAAHCGALLVVGDHALAAQVSDRAAPEDRPDAARAYAQLQRLLGARERPGLAPRQLAALDEARRGITEAAGMRVLEPAHGALAHHIAVRIPDEIDPATFFAYVQAERTPVRWLATTRPIHYAALRDAGSGAHAAAAELARWLLVPVGPDYSGEEISHAVLGVVKAAEYLGVRWRTDPARAAEYAAFLDEMYGADHDAYRPIFSTGA